MRGKFFIAAIIAVILVTPIRVDAQALTAERGFGLFGLHLPRLGTVATGLAAGVIAGEADLVSLQRQARPLVHATLQSWGTSAWSMRVSEIDTFLQHHRILGHKAIFNTLSYAIAQSGAEQNELALATTLGFNQAELANKVAFYQNHPALAEFGSGNLWSQGNQTLGEGIANEVQVLERREWLAANARKLLGMASGATFTAVNTNPKVEIHHVIPYSDPAAQRARNVLTTWLLSIHDPANAAILPSTCHRGPYAHGQPGKAYGNRIVAEFDVANVRARNVATASANIEPGRQVILETLRAIGDQISMNCGDARTVPMQAALRAVERPLPRPHIAHYLDAARVP